MAKSIPCCMACGKHGHSAQNGAANAYLCPMGGAHPWGDLVRAHMGACGRCGGANFRYSNGHEVSREGVRGYRCVACGAVKPEPGSEYRVIVTTPDGDRVFDPCGRDPFSAIAIVTRARDLADKKGWNYSYRVDRI